MMATKDLRNFAVTAAFLSVLSECICQPVATRPTAVSCDAIITVSTTGSDDSGDGSIGNPFRTPNRAVRHISESCAACTSLIGRTINLQSGTYELNDTLAMNGSCFDDLTIQTDPSSLKSGKPSAVVSGGRVVDGHVGVDGIWQASIADIRATSAPEHVFSIYVDGSRRRRPRTHLLRWARMLDPPHGDLPINHLGFVFANGTFNTAWDLSPESTRKWLLVAFHQWATDVHTIRSINLQNNTLLVNEPVPSAKYSFDDNVYGDRRFYVENVPEIPLSPGEFRVTDNRTLQYFPLASEVDAQGQLRADIKVVVPVLTSLLSMNFTNRFLTRHIDWRNTAWVLHSNASATTQTTNVWSWRDRHSLTRDEVQRGVPNAPRVLGGSGPLPVPTSMLAFWMCQNVTLTASTFTNGGANGLFALHTPNVLVSHTNWTDFGASAISVVVGDNSLVTQTRIDKSGQVWQQGVGVEMGHCTGCAVTHCALTRHPSDGVTFSGVGLTHNCVLSDTSFTAFGMASGLPYNETISDWGGVHTAHPNVTGTALTVQRCVFANFQSYRIGGYSLYFDFGSTGVNATQNLAYDTGSGIFLNSNKEVPAIANTWNYIADNIIVFRHATSNDFNIVVKWRSLVKNATGTRNIIFVNESADDAARAANPLQLFQDHTSTHPHQWENYTWNFNLYFRVSEAAACGNAAYDPFNATWPGMPSGATLHQWQDGGHDVSSLVGCGSGREGAGPTGASAGNRSRADPMFVNPQLNDFRLQPTSPALTVLGFQPFDASAVGPTST
eukprot:m.469986 g.469986  ORF g.469986 m.469986 type:complete len:781 (+) comp21651_c0_seq4:210-2552(+)